eukprot:gnl/TRDRNA2_/TRDRNA2_137344_c1_seq1.p1 gnl/TRDRNA2_/TRDRNA2_137344_c1~~gnl/TRDRNA2_/TRDRNA2_137344_c1_seq1.p1  ORF type:complete len:172 (-),score=17.87 gnl/TRDRNA2_/TRDRNA2_137344_c1_seq1:59-514(-)
MPPAVHNTAYWAGTSGWPSSIPQSQTPNTIAQPTIRAPPMVQQVRLASSIPDTSDGTDRLLAQVEYYFSDDNLATDFYLRHHMSDEGYVPLIFLSGLHGIRQNAPVNNDGSDLLVLLMLINSINQSTFLEMDEMRTKVRRVRDWQKWVWLQ